MDRKFATLVTSTVISDDIINPGHKRSVVRVNWTERIERHFVGDHGIEISRAADSENVERKETRTLVGQGQNTKLYAIIDVFYAQIYQSHCSWLGLRGRECVDEKLHGSSQNAYGTVVLEGTKALTRAQKEER